MPCRDCDERKPLCHSKCEKYLEARKYLDIQNEKRRKHNQEMSDLFINKGRKRKLR